MAFGSLIAGMARIASSTHSVMLMVIFPPFRSAQPFVQRYPATSATLSISAFRAGLLSKIFVILNEVKNLYQLRQECTYNQNYDSGHQDRYGLTGNAFPLLEDDAPDIAEHYVQAHEDAPAEGEEDGIIRKEALAKGQAEELAVPQKTCKAAEHKVITPEGLLTVVPPGFVLAVLIQAIAGVGNEAAEGHQHIPSSR